MLTYKYIPQVLTSEIDFMLIHISAAHQFKAKYFTFAVRYIHLTVHTY